MFNKLFKNNSNIKNLKLEPVDLIVLVSGVLVFAAIALATISNSSIWFDEAFSAYIIRFNFIDIWNYTSLDVHPPLYYWLLKIWSFLFGTTDIALRSMSVLFGGVSMVFGYLLLHRNFGRKAAFYGLLTLALSPILLRYSQEMRMYTLVLAIGLAATYVLQRAVESDSRKLWVVYGVLVSLGMWTHYFAAIIWLAHWTWRAVQVRREAGKKKLKLREFLQKFLSRNWIMTHVLAVGLFLPWLPYLIKQLIIVQAYGFWIPAISPVTITNFLTNTIIYQDQEGLSPWLTLAFIVLVPAVVFISIRGYKKLSKVQKSVYLLIVALAAVPPALLILASMPPLESSFIDRYLVTSSIAITMLIGLSLWFTKELKGRAVKAAVHVLVIGSLIIGVVNVYHYGNYNKISKSTSSAKQMVELIRDQNSGSLPIVTSDVWSYYDTVFYESDDQPVYFIDLEAYEYGSLEMLRTRNMNKIKDVNKFLDSHDAFWYVGNAGESHLEFSQSTRVQEQERLQVAAPIVNKPGYQAVLYTVNEE